MKTTGHTLKTWSGHLKLVALSILLSPIVAVAWGWFKHLIVGTQPFLDTLIGSPVQLMITSLLLAYPLLGCVYAFTGRPRFLAGHVSDQK